MAENQMDERENKKLRDYGARRIVAGHRNRCPLTTVEVVELYLNYLEPKNEKKLMSEQEFETFCHDFKRLIPKSKGQKLRGNGHLCMKEDLMKAFKTHREKFNGKNQRILEKSNGAYKNSHEVFEINRKDDEISLEDFARIVCVEENFLLHRELREYFNGGEEKIPAEVCRRIFMHYDKNQSGWLSEIELVGLLRDIFSIQRMREEWLGMPVSAPKEIAELMEYADEMCIKFSTTRDGLLTYDEMTKLLNETKEKKKK